MPDGALQAPVSWRHACGGGHRGRRIRPLPYQAPGFAGVSKSAMTYREFWQVYLAAHTDPRTRGLHYLGTLAGVASLAAAGVTRDWRWLLAAPVVGYTFSWFGH